MVTFLVLSKSLIWLVCGLAVLIAAALPALGIYMRMRRQIAHLEHGQDEDARKLRGGDALRQRLLAGIEAAGEGVALIDGDGRLTYMNGALMAIHAVPAARAAEFIGRDWRQLYSPAGRASIVASVMPALLRDGQWRDELQVSRIDGTMIWAEMSLRLLPGNSIVGTARDVTERRRAQEEREALQRQYEQAQKMESIGRMTGGIAHDFNNLLTVVSGHIDILRDDAPAALSPNIEAIQRAIDRGSEQTQRLLAFARRQVLKPERTDINRLVADSLALARSAIEERIVIESDLAPDLPVVAVDAGQFENAMLNLCINAGDALDGRAQGRISISTGAVQIDDTALPAGGDITPGQFTRVVVRDNGSGIPPEILEKVIDPFFTTKEVGRGSGLGLSMVYGFVSQSGGYMTIDSLPAEGTEIALYFPVAA